MKPWSLSSSPPPEKLSVGCRTLDAFFHGGVPTGQITELVSESSCGKTQLSLQLSLSSPSLYLHSDSPFPLKRLVTLSLSKPATRKNPLDSVFVRPLHHAHHLLDVLLQLEKSLLNLNNSRTQECPFRLIVVDSVAALFRSEFDNTGTDMKKRASLFFDVSGKLRELATRFGLAVVVTNQVVDVMGLSDGLRIGNYKRLFSSGREVGPALGLSWASCVNSRIFLSRDEVAVTEEGGLVRFVTKREIRVVFSPYLPESSCEYVISRDGVFGVECKPMVLKKTPSLDLSV